MTLEFKPHTRTDHAQLIIITEENFEELSKKFGWTASYSSNEYGKIHQARSFDGTVFYVGDFVSVGGHKTRQDDWVKDND